MFTAKTLAKSMMRQSSIFTPKMQLGAMTAFPKRFFDLHEYHSKKILGEFNINVQKGELAWTAEEAQAIASKFSNKFGIVVKAQVQAGGRGKGHLTSGMQGGVHILKESDQVFEKAKGMIGYNLITHQTTAAGLPVKSVLVHEGVDIEKEFYLAFLHDRPNQGLCCVFSKKGGMDIEKVAEEDPAAIHTKSICVNEGLTAVDAYDVCDKLGITGPMKEQGCEQLLKLYDMFIKIDSTQIEINPWAVTPDQDLYCVDAKIGIDPTAEYRQKDIADFHGQGGTSDATDVNEAKATAAGLNYIALDGNIGCMVNGAGLAMSTMDIISLKGGSPANFLDVGGGASATQVQTGFEILQAHPSVKAIFVNVFGGIIDCTLIADGVITAAKNVGLKIPVVVRLKGTNDTEANKIMTAFADANKGTMNITVVNDFNTAADTVIQVSQ